MTGALCAAAHADDFGDVFRGPREDHCVRRLVPDPSGRVAVLFPDRASGLEPLAKALLQHADGGFNPRLVAGQGGCLCHGGKLTPAKCEGKPDEWGSGTGHAARRAVPQKAGRCGGRSDVSLASGVPGILTGSDALLGHGAD